MVDRIQLVSFGITSIIILLLPLSDAKPCDIKADVCEYKFIVAYHLTMMKGKQLTKAVDGKLYPVDVVNTSAANPVSIDDVITLDGYPYSRKVVAVNGTIPGPAIEVYLGQTVIINVENQLYTSSVTIHWHGLEQKGTPFMDGVPYVTQCPIGPSQSFTYKFNVTQTGTFWYHSHMGPQRSMGLYGAFIIRNRTSVSMPEHLMVVTDYNHDWDSDTSYLKTIYGMYVKQKKLTPTYSFDKAHFSLFNFQSGLVNGRGRFYSSPGVHNGGPIAKFTVKQGTQYRFRVIAAGVLYPFQISVDGHKLQIVSSDGCELEPRTFDIFIINPGERYDFIITTNRAPGNYWIRGKTTEVGKNHTFEAILHYDGINSEEPNSADIICSKNYPCNVLNCPFLFYPRNEYQKCVIFSEMNSAFDYEVPRIESEKWEEHFLNFAFPGEPGHTPASVNGRQYVQPAVNPLYQMDEVNTLCEKQDCGVGRVCSCTHSLKLKKGDTIQMIFLNMGSGKGFDHPIHMHGHSFSVVKMGYPTYNMTTGAIISVNPDIDCRGDPDKNYCNDAAWSNSNWRGDNIPGIKLKKAPLKDTLIIPSGGYAVIRIKADNPGLWFMHCHIELHNLDGMAMFLNESFADVPEAPDHFPVCWSFTPEAISRIPTMFDVTTPLNQDRNSQKTPDQNQDRVISKTAFGILIAVICILVAILIFLIIVIVRRLPSRSSQVENDAMNLGFVDH